MNIQSLYSSVYLSNSIFITFSWIRICFNIILSSHNSSIKLNFSLNFYLFINLILDWKLQLFSSSLIFIEAKNSIFVRFSGLITNVEVPPYYVTLEKNYTQLFYLLSQKCAKKPSMLYMAWKTGRNEVFFFSPTLENRGENVETWKICTPVLRLSRDGAGYRQ